MGIHHGVSKKDKADKRIFEVYQKFFLRSNEKVDGDEAVQNKRMKADKLQINCHFHFLNFPTASSLLHIREILVHWPFLEISGPQKWVVGAALALKHNFLAGALNSKGINDTNVLIMLV